MCPLSITMPYSDLKQIAIGLWMLGTVSIFWTSQVSNSFGQTVNLVLWYCFHNSMNLVVGRAQTGSVMLWRWLQIKQEPLLASLADRFHCRHIWTAQYPLFSPGWVQKHLRGLVCDESFPNLKSLNHRRNFARLTQNFRYSLAHDGWFILIPFIFYL